VAGPQAGFVTVYFSNLLGPIRALQTLDTRLSDPDMSPMVRGAAGIWQHNFTTEGRRGAGHWSRLRPYTRQVREKRGYRPDHPILVQSGGLRRAAVDYPAEFRGKTMSRTTGRTPGGGGGPTTINIRTLKGRVVLNISGDKVANQHGEILDYTRNVPARPFWFVNSAVRQAAAGTFADQITKEFKKLGFK
jgi:hypothetical protein